MPGTVAFVHVVSGEVDVMLDHEAMRWGRSLEPGDKVALAADPPIRRWSRTSAVARADQVRLVVNGVDIAELKAGQRSHLKMRRRRRRSRRATTRRTWAGKRTREERIEWFLASIYCTCRVGGDGCTGDFYTLASCNPNGCGKPNRPASGSAS